MRQLPFCSFSEGTSVGNAKALSAALPTLTRSGRPSRAPPAEPSAPSPSPMPASCGVPFTFI